MLGVSLFFIGNCYAHTDKDESAFEIQPLTRPEFSGWIKTTFKELSAIANTYSQTSNNVSDAQLELNISSIQRHQIKLVSEGVQPIPAFMRALVDAGFERQAVTLYESFWVKPGLLEQLTGYSWGDKASLGLGANICDMERVQKQFWAEQATLFIGGFDKLDNQLRKAAFIADRWDKVINGRGKCSISLWDCTLHALINRAWTVDVFSKRGVSEETQRKTERDLMNLLRVTSNIINCLDLNISSMPNAEVDRLTLKGFAEGATRKMLEVSKAHSMLRYKNPFHQKQFILAVEGELQTYLSGLFFGSKTRTKDTYFGAFVESFDELPDDMVFTPGDVRFIRVQLPKVIKNKRASKCKLTKCK